MCSSIGFVCCIFVVVFRFFVFFFFFKQKTAYEIGTGDWSSDVCSSDLGCMFASNSTRATFSVVATVDLGLAHMGAGVSKRILWADRKSVV